MDDSIRAFVLTVLRDQMNLAIPDDVGYDTPLGAEGLGLGSLIILELSMRSEDEYDVDIIPAFEGGFPKSLGEFVDRVDMARKT